MPKISIIIPAFQAEKLITRTLEILLECYNEKIKSKEIEIIVVNDGSKDKTQEILEKYVDYITILKNEKNMGRGFSVRKAYLTLDSDYALFTDADLPYGTESTNLLIEKLKSGDQCVVGERDAIENNWFRRLTHWGFLVCEKIILGVRFKDTQCGLKGFQTEIIQEVSRMAISNRFAFEVETMYLLKNAKIKIEVLKVPQADYGESTIKIKDIFSMLFDLFKIRFHKYDLKTLKNYHVQ